MFSEAFMPIKYTARPAQRGATLIIALVFLLILTIAGITAVQLATTNERMASNSQFRGVAFQFAQSELKAQLLRFSTNIANLAPLQLAQDQTIEAITGFPNRRAALALNAQIAANGLTQTSRVNSMRKVDCLLLGVGDSAETFTCTQYEMTTRSTLSGGAYSEQVNGLYLIR